MAGKTSRTRRITFIVGAILAWSVTGTAMAGVDVGVNVNIGPPPIVAPAPPEVVLMPRYGVYYVPGLSFNVFFYNGYWWSPRGDRWYRAREYGGPWRTIGRRYVPGPVARVPRDYRSLHAHERHIPYGEWRERNFRHERHEMRGREEHRERGDGGEHGRGGGHGR